MKIAFLTASSSRVLESIPAIAEGDRVTVVDFSPGASLAPLCQTLRLHHIPFGSWDSLESSLPDYDLLLSYRLPRIIPMPTVARFRYGGINIHPSLLPKYRGANPWFQMYLNKDLEGGVTIHRIAETPDTGNILAQQPFSIFPDEPIPSAREKADCVAAALLTDVIARRLYLTEGTPQQGIPLS